MIYDFDPDRLTPELRDELRPDWDYLVDRYELGEWILYDGDDAQPMNAAGLEHWIETDDGQADAGELASWKKGLAILRRRNLENGGA